MESNPYLAGPYAPVVAEHEAELELIEGAVPVDLAGMVVRNGPNRRFEADGRYHWFDGDGMLHAVRFEDGRATYRNRWVRTAGLQREEREGRALWRGLSESTAHNPKGAPYKDTGNTDVVAHNGWLLATWYICGAAHQVSPLDLTTAGPASFGREQPLRLSAHAKVDRQTGELLFFDYGPTRPYLRYGVVSPGGELVHHVDIDLPGPRLPHDMAFTCNYALLMDLPLFARPEALREKRWLVDYHTDTPARFGIVPRRGAADSIRWFEADPCYIYHAVNAWEDGDEVVLVACRCDDPLPQPDPSDGAMARMLANLRLSARLCQWRFNLVTGAVREELVDDRNCEFPTLNEQSAGRRSRFAYLMSIPRARTLLFDGIVKYDLDSGGSERLAFGPGRYGSEAPFGARTNGSAEDDGYLLSFVDVGQADGSELWVVDAQRMGDGPVAKLRIPARVPLGFHGCWVSDDELKIARSRVAT